VLVFKVDLLWKNGAKDEGIILLEGVAITVFMETGLKVRCSCMQTALCDDYLGFWWEQAKDYPWKKYPLCPWWIFCWDSCIFWCIGQSSLLIRRIFWFLFCLFVFFELLLKTYIILMSFPVNGWRKLVCEFSERLFLHYNLLFAWKSIKLNFLGVFRWFQCADVKNKKKTKSEKTSFWYIFNWKAPSSQHQTHTYSLFINKKKVHWLIQFVQGHLAYQRGASRDEQREYFRKQPSNKPEYLKFSHPNSSI
jgi:hypothetical protein